VLTALKTLKNPQGRLAQWANYLQDYNYTIVYRPGKDNGNADGLSRLPKEGDPPGHWDESDKPERQLPSSKRTGKGALDEQIAARKLDIAVIQRMPPPKLSADELIRIDAQILVIEADFAANMQCKLKKALGKADNTVPRTAKMTAASALVRPQSVGLTAIPCASSAVAPVESNSGLVHGNAKVSGSSVQAVFSPSINDGAQSLPTLKTSAKKEGRRNSKRRKAKGVRKTTTRSRGTPAERSKVKDAPTVPAHAARSTGEKKLEEAREVGSSACVHTAKSLASNIRSSKTGDTSRVRRQRWNNRTRGPQNRLPERIWVPKKRLTDGKNKREIPVTFGEGPPRLERVIDENLESYVSKPTVRVTPEGTVVGRRTPWMLDVAMVTVPAKEAPSCKDLEIEGNDEAAKWARIAKWQEECPTIGPYWQYVHNREVSKAGPIRAAIMTIVDQLCLRD